MVHDTSFRRRPSHHRPLWISNQVSFSLLLHFYHASLMIDRQGLYIYTYSPHFLPKYLYQVGRSTLQPVFSLLVSPAYGQELYVGVDDGADCGSADTGVPTDRCRREASRDGNAVSRTPLSGPTARCNSPF